MNLVTVQGAMQLDSPTANAWFAFERASVAEKRIDPIITSPAGAWRSEAMVVDMWYHPERYGATQGTARPISLGGGGSIHQKGRSVDVYNWRAYGLFKWSARANLAKLANRFGFRHTIDSEAWHLEHDGVTATGGGSSGSKPIPESEEDEVLIKANQDSAHAKAGYVYRLVEGSFAGITNLEGNTLVPHSQAHVEAYDANEIELWFKLYGLWEQEPVPVATFGGAKTPLKGLGRRTGRLVVL